MRIPIEETVHDQELKELEKIKQKLKRQERRQDEIQNLMTINYEIKIANKKIQEEKVKIEARD